MAVLPYNPELDTLDFKIEAALVKFLLTAGLPAAQLFTGEDIEDRVLPAIVCKCLGGPEEEACLATFLQDVAVCVISNTDPTNSDADPFPPHRRIARKVRFHLWDSKLDPSGIEWLHSYLSCQVPGLNILREIKLEDAQETIRDRKIETELRFKMSANEMSGLVDARADYAAGRLRLGQLPEDLALLFLLQG